MKKQKLNIFLDIDDVIFQWNEAYAKHFNVEIPTVWDGNPDMPQHLNILSKDKTYWLNLPVKNRPNFQPKGFVSARGIPKTWTKESLKINQIPGRSHVYQVNWGMSKLELLKSLGCNLFIDDKIATFEELNKAGIPCLLMTASTNMKYKTDLRVSSLDIKEIEKVYARAIN